MQQTSSKCILPKAKTLWLRLSSRKRWRCSGEREKERGLRTVPLLSIVCSRCILVKCFWGVRIRMRSCSWRTWHVRSFVWMLVECCLATNTLTQTHTYGRVHGPSAHLKITLSPPQTFVARRLAEPSFPHFSLFPSLSVSLSHFSVASCPL